MRSFKCYDCGHQFQVTQGTGGPGSQMVCPTCGSRKIHRAKSDRGFAYAGLGRGASDLGRGRGGRRRAPRWPRW
ncbi:MAG: hypothetical protein CEE40_11340 [Chloroflexi bacterium B3_Chlor]|nr:MAG: hypothetical protein CEE40_11340 [Chloroflexi bacterium B3_Chlor]